MFYTASRLSARIPFRSYDLISLNITLWEVPRATIILQVLNPSRNQRPILSFLSPHSAERSNSSSCSIEKFNNYSFTVNHIIIIIHKPYTQHYIPWGLFDKPSFPFAFRIHVISLQLDFRGFLSENLLFRISSFQINGEVTQKSMATHLAIVFISFSY